MHELSLAQDIIRMVDAHLPEEAQAQTYPVESVWVVLGPYSGVEKECLRFGFDALKEGSACASATLEIETPPATSTCLKCDLESTGFPLETCPSCGHNRLKLASGCEFFVKSFSIKDPT